MIPTQRTILVGEDDSELRGYFEAVAISMGYAATIAADGAELLRALDRNEAIDLVLLDVILPVQDGIEVLRAIRRGHASIPVIMISDAASGTDAAQAIRMGANGFLLKPINHQELRRAIQAATRVAVESRAGQEAPEISIGSGPLFFGANRRMQDIGRLLRNIGESDAVERRYRARIASSAGRRQADALIAIDGRGLHGTASPRHQTRRDPRGRAARERAQPDRRCVIA